MRKDKLEPSKLIKNIEAINSKKITFEKNEIKMPNGITSVFGMVKHPGAALAVPIDKNNTVIVLRQYRFAVARRILEFPAGTLEENEVPIDSIKREIQEESGYEARNWNQLGTLVPCPGYSDEEIHMFLARDLTLLDKKPEGDEDEDIEVIRFHFDEFDKIISSGDEILDGKTITAWHLAKQFLNS